MDLNGDGKVDILSGSYSRDEGDMAGLFQVLWGVEGGGFKAPAVLNGTDGQPLIIADDDDIPRICTRPTAVDLNGDGKLDIVSGNFAGTFAFFPGEGEGRFAPKHTLLTGADGASLNVDDHSDPFFVDWDGDGDLDLLSGSASGGVSLFVNLGSKKEAKFGKPVALVPAVENEPSGARMGDEWLKGPQSDTRVWADDLNGDGKLDLLIGDSVTLVYPAAGLEVAQAREKLAEWSARMEKAGAALRAGGGPTAEDKKKYQEEWQKLRKERETIVREDSTGFVWVMYRK
ncbi:MAG: VCBS repeat-containing protein [Planctomycetota bacterium]